MIFRFDFNRNLTVSSQKATFACLFPSREANVSSYKHYCWLYWLYSIEATVFFLTGSFFFLCVRINVDTLLFPLGFIDVFILCLDDL